MHPLRGIGYKLVSVLLFIIMSSLIKFTSDEIPSGEAVFFRAVFALPVIVIWLLWQRDFPSGIMTRRPINHLLRGVIGTTSMALLFSGLAYLPLPEVTAIGYAAPLLTVVFAALFLKEKVGLFRISAVILGMLGVMIVLAPRLSIFDGAEAGRSETIGALLVLGGAFFGALAQIQVRRMVPFDKSAAIVFWFMFSSALLSLLTLPFGWVMPSPSQMVALAGAGLFGGLAQILLTEAYRSADASLVAPFEYASMLFALVIGWYFFAEIPSITMLIGASIVIFAGIIIILREQKLQLDRSRARKVTTPQG